jgi:LysM repeat protein
MRTLDNAGITSSQASSTRTHTHDRGNVHVCKPGDTLWDIARAHGVSLAAVRKANPQLEGRGIFSGTHVHIPAATNTATSTTPDVPAPARRALAADVKEASRRTGAAVDDEARRRIDAQQACRIRDAEVGGLSATTATKSTSTAPKTEGGKLDVSSTKNMTEAQRFDFYKSVIEQNGGRFHTAPNARNIVGLRHETDPLKNGGRGADDDKFVMLWQDKNGRKHVKEFTGTTEGSDDVRRSFSSDVNGDGSRDLGRIPLGHYEYMVGSSDRLGRVLRPTQAFQVERDFNHDGQYSGKKERNADTSSAFLFHAGTSAGCQTMDAATFQSFWRSLTSSGSPSKIGYTLVAV